MRRLRPATCIAPVEHAAGSSSLLHQHSDGVGQLKAVGRAGRQGGGGDDASRVEAEGRLPWEYGMVQDRHAAGCGHGQAPIRSQVQLEPAGVDQGVVTGTDEDEIAH